MATLDVPQTLERFRVAQTSYDTIPYPSYATTATHPLYLHLVGRLHGLTPAAVETCTVLEIGCSDGGNLLPMACALPDATFTGIDLSAVEITRGEQSVAALGLDNVTLIHGDICDYATLLDTPFDYVIVHGVFSWVPRHVQQAILSLCQDYLTPNGIAFISYNTLPGWHHFNIMRDFLKFHTRNIAEPTAQIALARDLLAKLSFVEDAGVLTAHQSALRQAARLLEDQTDTYLFHDFMETVNDPMYFKDFVEIAEGYELQYLANAYNSDRLQKHVADQSHGVFFDENTQSVIEQEQYLDLFGGNAFRQTLLCHANAVTKPTPTVDEFETGLCLASNVRAEFESEIVLRDATRVTFDHSSGASIGSAHPLTKALFVALQSQWPRPIPFMDAVDAAAKMLSDNVIDIDPDDLQILKTNLLQAFQHDTNLVEFHYWVYPVASAQTKQSAPFAYADLQLARGERLLANVRHELVEIDDVDAEILQRLAAGLDDDEICQHLFEWVKAGRFLTTHDDQVFEGSAAQIKTAVRAEMVFRKQRLAQNALLVNGGHTK